jgi:hypothetical protein
LLILIVLTAFYLSIFSTISGLSFYLLWPWLDNELSGI